MGKCVSKLSELCPRKKRNNKIPTPAPEDPYKIDEEEPEMDIEDFDDGGIIERNRDNYFHKEDIEKIAGKYDKYKEWMTQSVSSTKSRMKNKKIKWREGEIIGTGSFGRVILGLNLQAGSIMAVKQVQIGSTNNQSQQERIKALEIEIEVLSQFTHKNIVRYYGSHQDKTTFNIFLEYISGGTIASLIEKYGPLNETLARVYTRQILEGLEYLHVRNTVHRDIKGANVLVDNSGVCKLADFGTAKRISSLVEGELRYLPSIRGTVNWMAPEVIRQTSLGRQSDIWSVGCTVLEMVTGKMPWAHLVKPGISQVAALYKIASAKTHPPLPEGLSPEAVDFLKQCFTINPADRPNVVQLLNHKFISGGDADKGVSLEISERQRSASKPHPHHPPSTRKKADSGGLKSGADKPEHSRNISSFSRQRIDSNGIAEETDPVLLPSSPVVNREERKARDTGGRPLTGQDSKHGSRKFTFNNAEQKRSESLKKPSEVLPSLPDANYSNVHLVSRQDSFADGDLQRRERTDNEYVITDNDSHQVFLTTQGGGRDTSNHLITDPSPETNKLLRNNVPEQKPKYGPVPIVPIAEKKPRTRPLGKNDANGKGSIGGKDDDLSQIAISTIGDVPNKKPNDQMLNSFHVRSPSNFGIKDFGNLDDGTKTARERLEGEERKLDSHRPLMFSPIESHRSDTKNLLRTGRTFEGQDSSPYFQGLNKFSARDTGHSRITIETGGTHREFQESERSILFKMRYNRDPPAKKTSIKVKEAEFDTATEINIETDRGNGGEPQFGIIPVADLTADLEARKNNGRNL